MKLSVITTVSVEVDESSAKEYGDMIRYSCKHEEGFVFVQDGRLVLWETESRYKFVVFQYSWNHGELVEIKYNDQYRLFNKKTRKAVTWTLENGETFVSFQDSRDYGELVDIKYNDQWRFFDKKTREEFKMR